MPSCRYEGDSPREWFAISLKIQVQLSLLAGCCLKFACQVNIGLDLATLGTYEDVSFL